MQNSYCKISIAFFFFLLAILLFVGYTPPNDGDGYIEYALMSLKDGQPYPSHSTIMGQSFIWNIGQINLIALSLWLTRSIVPVLVLMCALKAVSAYVVARIAELTGFQNAFFFSKLFKKHMNISPLQYRKNANAGHDPKNEIN